MRKTNKITFFNILSTILLKCITIITAPIISRMLGTDNYGTVTIYITWVSIVTTVFGLQTSSTLAVSKSNYPIEDQSKYQSSVLWLSIVSYGIFSAFIMILIEPLSKLLEIDIPFIVCVLIQGFGQYCVIYFNTKNTYEFKAKYNFYIAILISLSTTVLSIILIYVWPTSEKFWGRILGLLLPYAILGIVIIVYVLKRGKTFYRREYWKFCIALSIPMLIHDLSNLVLNQSDRVMLQKMCGNSDVGIYSLAVNFSMVISSVWVAFNNSWVPFYYEYQRTGKYDQMMRRAKYYLEIFSVLVMGFVLLAPEVYNMFADKDFWDGGIIIPFAIIGYYFVFLYSFPVNYEIYNKKTNTIAIATLLSAGINVILNLLFIPVHGIIGAAIATAIAHGFQFVFHQIAASGMTKEGENYIFRASFLYKYGLIVLAILLFGVMMRNVWMIRWLVGVILGIVELWRIIKRRALF